jgi:hypothetical protein
VHGSPRPSVLLRAVHAGERGEEPAMVSVDGSRRSFCLRHLLA